ATGLTDPAELRTHPEPSHAGAVVVARGVAELKRAMENLAAHTSAVIADGQPFDHLRLPRVLADQPLLGEESEPDGVGVRLQAVIEDLTHRATVVVAGRSQRRQRLVS